MRNEVGRITNELPQTKEKIKDNQERIKVNKTLPYLVANVIEVLDLDPLDPNEEGGNVDLDEQRQGQSAIIKTSTRATYYLPVVGLVDPSEMKPGDLVVRGHGFYGFFPMVTPARSFLGSQ